MASVARSSPTPRPLTSAEAFSYTGMGEVMGKVKYERETLAQVSEAIEQLEKTYGLYIATHLHNDGSVVITRHMGRVVARFGTADGVALWPAVLPRRDAQRSEQGPVAGGDGEGKPATPARCGCCRQLASRVGPLDAAGTCVGCQEYLFSRRGSD